ncbi:MAG: hypothetical protein H6626_03475 [Pseudobdellovibrionaceae bacterium]|nr:hypothetical protein [Bdellovibrionales bacterium]USN48162.1 MAG: hypothetical protein H6626_03475 [Pseudobdellovibrionaceae bacterium]
MRLLHFLFVILITVSFPSISGSEEYQIFDGRFYNGLFYPRIDIIEWGEPIHLQFQIYDKVHQIDISGQAIDHAGRTIFEVAFDFTFRGERLCRRVLAPPTFRPNEKLYFYVEKDAKDINNILVSAQPIKDKVPYQPKPFSKCIEIAAQTPEKNPADTGRRPAGEQGPRTIFDQHTKENMGDKGAKFEYQPIDSDYNLFGD